METLFAVNTAGRSIALEWLVRSRSPGEARNGEKTVSCLDHIPKSCVFKKKKTLSETLEKPRTGEVALSEVMGHEQGHVSQWWGSEKVGTGNWKGNCGENVNQSEEGSGMR